MPRKNTIRHDSADTFYHIYNCGNNKSNLFLDDSDYRYFEMLLGRGLSSKKSFDKFSRQYPNFSDGVELHAYCLMPDHFHLLLYQNDVSEINKFMRSVGTAYSMYFNKKHKRTGQLYESRFKAIQIQPDERLEHISRYIHLNPISYMTYAHSSYSDYIYSPRDWVTTEFILKRFKTPKLYADFIADYEGANKANDKYLQEIGEI